jgi:hypothetical protein
LKPEPKQTTTSYPPIEGTPLTPDVSNDSKGTPYSKPEDIDDQIKKFRSITVSGKVPLEKYTELFNYFITPFAMSGNKIDIEVSFKINTSAGSQLDESKQQYKNAKEAARQLGLNFSEDE